MLLKVPRRIKVLEPEGAKVEMMRALNFKRMTVLSQLAIPSCEIYWLLQLRLNLTGIKDNFSRNFPPRNLLKLQFLKLNFR